MEVIDPKNHDVLKLKEIGRSDSRPTHVAVGPYPYGGEEFIIGSIFLSLRKRKVLNFDFAGRTVKKEFPEIALAPDGRVVVLEKMRCSLIRPIDT